MNEDTVAQPSPNPQQPGYVPVPVATAQRVAEDFAKSIVIICTWDPLHGLLHTTTYGRNEQEKAWAADGGEIVAKALGAMPEVAQFFENYRTHCCAASGHIRLLPDRECTSCGTPAAVCEARPVAQRGASNSDCGPCCSKCLHPGIRCSAHSSKATA